MNTDSYRRLLSEIVEAFGGPEELDLDRATDVAVGEFWAAWDGSLDDQLQRMVRAQVRTDLRARGKRSRTFVQQTDGRRHRTPALYGRTIGDRRVLASWRHLPLPQLRRLINDLAHQSGRIVENLGAMRYGFDLAVRQGTGTAAEAFALAGMAEDLIEVESERRRAS